MKNNIIFISILFVFLVYLFCQEQVGSKKGNNSLSRITMQSP